MKVELTELIDHYGKLKAEADVFKKQIDADNTKIKSILLENNEVSATGKEYNVVCKAVQTSKLNEETL